MKERMLTAGFLMLSLVFWKTGIFLSDFYDCGSMACDDLVTRLLALYYGMPALAVVFFFLIFIPRAFQSWKKFAIWFIPLAALLFLAYQDPRGWDYLFFPYREEFYRWVSALYVLISLVIIARSSTK